MRDEHQEHWAREHRWTVIGTVAGVLGVIALLLVRWGKDRDREAELEGIRELQAEVDRLQREPPPVAMPEPPPPVATPPLRFEVVVDGQPPVGLDQVEDIHFIELAPARSVWDGISFAHGAEVNVSALADGSLVAAIEGASLTIVPAGEVSTAGFPGTGAPAGQPAPVTRAGQPGMGQRRDTGAVIESYRVEVGKRALGLLLYRDGADRDVTELEAVMSSLGARGGPPAQFRVEPPGHEVSLDQKVAVGKGRKAVIRRRPTIKRRLGGLELEHPWGLAVSQAPSDVTTIVFLRSRRVGIRVVLLPVATSIKTARPSLLGGAAFRDDGEAQLSGEGDEVRGLRAILTDDTRAEVYVVRRGHKYIGVVVYYAAADEAAALEMAEPVLRSVR